MDRYAVVGNPIAHSRSPDIHRAFAVQTCQELTYDKLLVQIGVFDEQVKQFFMEGGKGLNVTVPFKEDAFRYADSLTERAQLAGAVNTLALQKDGTVLGDTTDGAGLVADLIAHEWPLQQRRVLLIGAGGAARGVIPALLQRQPADLVVANRTVAKAQALAERFQSLGAVSACGFTELDGECFDLIINGTSASLAGDLPPLPQGVIQRESAVYDMMYGAEFTPFLRWAQDQGAQRLADGLGMLVEQAAESFTLWRGVRPEVKAVEEALRLTLAASA